MKIVPIIPSLNPDYKLERLVDELIENDFKKIIVVNDGSSDNSIFDKLDKKEECIILTHEVNRGKGCALKTAFKYYQDNLSCDYCGVITLDSDGQHSVSDVINISNVLVDNENNSVLVDNDESWKDKYYNTPSIDIKEEFTQEELDILSKLKIDYEDKVYTIYEYDLMKQKFYEYYYKKQDEWKMRRYKKSLHSVGVSIKEYEILVRKIEILDEKYYKNII